MINNRKSKVFTRSILYKVSIIGVFAGLVLLWISAYASSEVPFSFGYEQQHQDQKQKSVNTENLIVVTLDGLRWQELFQGADPMLINSEEFVTGDIEQLKEKYWAEYVEQRREKLMPFVWGRLVKEGKLYGNRQLGNYVNVSNPYWFSYPGYNEIWTGYPDTTIDKNKYPANPNPNVLEFINEQPNFEGEVAAITSHKFFDRILHTERNNLKLKAGYEDSTTYKEAKRYMKEKQPKVTYIAFSNTDHYAHHKEYDRYLESAHQIDSYIRDLWDFVQQHKSYKDKTTLFITTDHGRGLGINWYTHGKHNGVAHADEIWFAVAGPDTRPTGEQTGNEHYSMNQFAKTMAALLGLRFDTGKAVGQPIESVLDR